MPGKQVKNWKVYHECMKGKDGTDKDKEYCARVANAVDSGDIKHSNVPDLVRFGVEQGLKDAGYIRQ